MKLDSVLPESKIFIDTNIFLYDITDHPEFGVSTKNLLKNIELGIFQGKTSIIVLNELLHKLVIGEIAEKYGLKLFQVISCIKQDPTILSNLKSYELVNKIELIPNFEIISVSKEIFSLAKSYMVKYNLMTNDAIIVATCNINGISNISSNDGDFDRVDFLVRWYP
ncbi:hypothetical protein ig2599ANME_1217 [groundwater metagenome]